MAESKCPDLTTLLDILRTLQTMQSESAADYPNPQYIQFSRGLEPTSCKPPVGPSWGAFFVALSWFNYPQLIAVQTWCSCLSKWRQRTYNECARYVQLKSAMAWSAGAEGRHLDPAKDSSVCCPSHLDAPTSKLGLRTSHVRGGLVLVTEETLCDRNAGIHLLPHGHPLSVDF